MHAEAGSVKEKARRPPLGQAVCKKTFWQVTLSSKSLGNPRRARASPRRQDSSSISSSLGSSLSLSLGLRRMVGALRAENRLENHTKGRKVDHRTDTFCNAWVRELLRRVVAPQISDELQEDNSHLSSGCTYPDAGHQRKAAHDNPKRLSAAKHRPVHSSFFLIACFWTLAECPTGHRGSVGGRCTA